MYVSQFVLTLTEKLFCNTSLTSTLLDKTSAWHSFVAARAHKG